MIRANENSVRNAANRLNEMLSAKYFLYLGTNRRSMLMKSFIYKTDCDVIFFAKLGNKIEVDSRLTIKTIFLTNKTIMQ